MAIVVTNNIILGQAQLAVPLRHPRILYQSHLRTGTVTASGEASDEFAADNASLDPSTATFWRPDAMPASLEVELAQAAAADYCLIAAHTLGTEQTTLTVDYHDGDDWVEIHEVLPGSDRVLVILFDEETRTKFRIGLAGATVPSIGVAMLGKALAMPKGVTPDHGPITLQRRTVHETNLSGTGQFLGRSVRREGVATHVAFSHLEAAFVRGDFAGLVEHARTTGAFGWAWNPADWPAEVAYVWTNDDIRPAHGDVLTHLSVGFDIEGLLD